MNRTHENRLPIGALRHRLVIESAVRVPDDGGGVSRTWSNIAEVWAAIDPVKGRETVVAEAVTGSVSFVIHIRYRNDVVPAMRFRLGTRVFEILAVFDASDRRRFLKCLVQERGL